jgi:YfiH family protein
MSYRLLLSEKKDGPIENKQDIKKFLEKKGINKKLIRADLAHGKKVAIVNKNSKKLIKKTDGLITKDDLALAVTVADCLPIYFYSPKITGILHGGWRGIEKGIVEEMIKKLKAVNEKPKNLSVFIGPSIKVCHFEVGDDLVEKFLNYKDCFRKEKSKKFLNLQKVVKLKLKDKNVENIKISSRCTYCSPELFSYRKEGEVNKILAVITK